MGDALSEIIRRIVFVGRVNRDRGEVADEFAPEFEQPGDDSF